ncbi:hypothetical protein RRG08_031202 [Elysia crispata]|uniref:Uncharacterized protein n=1 Tax=Elysia crispata TaxID=231223 RepID=A0AAE1CIU9_9GAST|nr:hypothetical protein RRG08_031202 [Elysia crispata]
MGERKSQGQLEGGGGGERHVTIKSRGRTRIVSRQRKSEQLPQSVSNGMCGSEPCVCVSIVCVEERFVCW